MPYIPEQHKKYNLLPICQKNGGEVFEYPSALLAQLEEHGIYHLDPYGFDSNEAYYAELDKRQSEADDTTVKELFEKYRTHVMELNQKEYWSVLKYIGEDTDTLFGLTKGLYYYWPCEKENASFRGVIDDEEYTAYEYPTEAILWKIAEDPTGMAYRTIYEGKNYISQKKHDSMIQQAEVMLKVQQKMERR